MIIDFYDEEDVYGTIETNEDVERLKVLLEEYKELDMESGYNIDAYFEYLEQKGIKFKVIPEADVSIYF